MKKKKKQRRHRTHRTLDLAQLPHSTQGPDVQTHPGWQSRAMLWSFLIETFLITFTVCVLVIRVSGAARQARSYFTQKIPPNKSTLHVLLSFSHRIFLRANWTQQFHSRFIWLHTDCYHIVLLPPAAELNDDIFALNHTKSSFHFSDFNLKFWFATFIYIVPQSNARKNVQNHWRVSDFPCDSTGGECVPGQKHQFIVILCKCKCVSPALGVDHSNCTNECAPQWWH